MGLRVQRPEFWPLACVCMCVLSRVRLFATLWTVAPLVPLSMEFSGQEYGNALPLPTPGDFHDSQIKPVSFASPILSGRVFPSSTTSSLGPPNKSPCENGLFCTCTVHCGGRLLHGVT